MTRQVLTLTKSGRNIWPDFVAVKERGVIPAGEPVWNGIMRTGDEQSAQAD